MFAVRAAIIEGKEANEVDNNFFIASVPLYLVNNVINDVSH